ncbi:hypothetical protein [Marinobacter salicampi]|uniref:hypothetical protein n=1 Tax=Marinobacter salicampi TaxID=435907 RepID=UPI001409BB5E|nr:hypothetical protein [Marinobacter salicampi]
MDNLTHMVSSALAAAQQGYGALSTGEALAAALVLNDAEALADRGVSIAEALERIGKEWASLIPAVSKRVASRLGDIEQTRQQGRLYKAEQRVLDLAGDAEPVDLEAKYVTHGEAPGYRDIYLTLKLAPIGAGIDGPQSVTATVRLNAEDSAVVAKEILNIHRFAWRNGDKPIDVKEGEHRPSWLA